MKLIPLTQGKVAMVDDADFEAVSRHKWFAEKVRRELFYAARNVRKPDGLQRLHSFLMPEIAQIDHRDGNGLNNQRENLRPATNAQNRQGAQQKKIGASSKYRGVSWNEQSQKWESKIKVKRKTIYLGRFINEGDAARARDKATLKYYGPDAQFNFPI